MSTTNKNQGSDDNDLGFYSWRQQWLDEIIFYFDSRRFIDHVDQLVGWAIAFACYKGQRSTYIGPDTIARRLGGRIKTDRVQLAMVHLETAGRLKIEKRGAHYVLTPVILNDAALRSSSGSRSFYLLRSKRLERILYDKRLSPSCRLIGYAAAAFADPETLECREGHSALASAVGVSRNSARNAVKPLAEGGHFGSRLPTRSAPWVLTILPADEGANQGANEGANQGANESVTSADAAATSREILRTLLDLRNLRNLRIPKKFR